MQFEKAVVPNVWQKKCMIQGNINKYKSNLGLVETKFPVTSFLDGITKLICSFYFEKNIYSNKKLESVSKCLENLNP